MFSTFSFPLSFRYGFRGELSSRGDPKGVPVTISPPRSDDNCLFLSDNSRSDSAINPHLWGLPAPTLTKVPGARFKTLVAWACRTPVFSAISETESAPSRPSASVILTRGGSLLVSVVVSVSVLEPVLVPVLAPGLVPVLACHKLPILIQGLLHLKS